MKFTVEESLQFFFAHLLFRCQPMMNAAVKQLEEDLRAERLETVRREFEADMKAEVMR